VGFVVTGDLWSWGTGVLGELGQAYITNSPKPARIIKAPNDTKFKMVAVGQEHSLALTGMVRSHIKLGIGTSNASFLRREWPGLLMGWK
jgi:alpha-tubulin suppressor-like RCC1 family protein